MVDTWSAAQSAAMRECPRKWWYGHVVNAQPARRRSMESVRMAAIREGLAATYRTDARKDSDSNAFLAYWERHGADLPAYEREDALRCLLETVTHLRSTETGNTLWVDKAFGYGNGLTGTMDLALRTGPASAHIRKWTWSYLATPREILEDPHLNLCAAWLQNTLPVGTAITLGVYRVRHQQETTIKADQGVIESTVEKLHIDWIDSARRVSQGDVTPTPGPHCVSCRFAPYCPEGPPHTVGTVLADSTVTTLRAHLNRRLSRGRDD